MNICLFDIDGTLISSGGAGRAALEGAFAGAFGMPLRTRDLKSLQYSGRTDRAIIRDLFRLHGLDDTPENCRRLLTGYLGHLPACLARHEGRVLPGIGALLNHLRERSDAALGLLTGNVRDGARVKLGHYGLFDHFAFGGFGDNHYDRDDVAREAFAVVQGRFADRVAVERIWVIGDTPLDVSCARAIGVRVAAVATGWHSFEELEAARPDLLLRDFTDPEPLLAVLR